MPRKSEFEIELDRHEKKYLQKIAQKYTSPYYQVIREKAILLAVDSLQNKEIGERLDLPMQIISKWRKRFFDERVAGLQDRPRRGRPRRFSP